MDKYQQIRIRVAAGDSIIRINGETDKNYKYVKGIYVSLPSHLDVPNATLGLKIGQVQLFDDRHEVKLLTCSNNVAPNDMFFKFDGLVEASGSVVEGRFSHSPLKGGSGEVIIYLWLSNANK